MYSGDEIYGDDVTSVVEPVPVTYCPVCHLNDAYPCECSTRRATIDPSDLDLDDHDHEPEDMALGFAGDPAREYPDRAFCTCGVTLMLTEDGWEVE